MRRACRCRVRHWLHPVRGRGDGMSALKMLYDKKGSVFAFDHEHGGRCIAQRLRTTRNRGHRQLQQVFDAQVGNARPTLRHHGRRAAQQLGESNPQNAHLPRKPRLPYR